MESSQAKRNEDLSESNAVLSCVGKILCAPLLETARQWTFYVCRRMSGFRPCSDRQVIISGYFKQLDDNCWKKAVACVLIVFQLCILVCNVFL